MQYSKIVTLGLFQFGTLLMALYASPCFTVTAQAEDRHVVVVSLDGLAAFLLDDPNASLPTLRRLANEGSHVVDGMTVSNPSVTWPNHTTLITGVRPEQHGVLANGVLVRGGPGVPVRIDGARPHADLVRVRSVVDVAHEKGLRTAEINWPCTRQSASFDDSFPDVPDSLKYTTPRLVEELKEQGLLVEKNGAPAFGVPSPAGKDWVWTQAACHVIRERKPHLTLVHLLNVDSTHHNFGAQTPAGYTANAYMDLCLAQILQAVSDAGILDRTTFIIVSDHGFISTPQAIKPNVLLRNAGLLKAEGNRIVDARVHVVPEGGIGLVYCTNPLERVDLEGTIRDVFANQEGVADIIFADRFAEYGFPLPREYEQAPDAVLAAKEGYSVSSSVEGDLFVDTHTRAGTSLGSHGFLSTNPKMNALCILWGCGIDKGGKLHNEENTFIAPLIAKLLSL